jgi:hypothetical protein
VIHTGLERGNRTSWRRDSNPQPSTYKADALAELSYASRLRISLLEVLGADLVQEPLEPLHVAYLGLGGGAVEQGPDQPVDVGLDDAGGVGVDGNGALVVGLGLMDLQVAAAPRSAAR